MHLRVSMYGVSMYGKIDHVCTLMLMSLEITELQYSVCKTLHTYEYKRAMTMPFYLIQVLLPVSLKSVLYLGCGIADITAFIGCAFAAFRTLTWYQSNKILDAISN